MLHKDPLAPIPIIVDFDKTFSTSDSFFELLFITLFKSPKLFFSLIPEILSRKNLGQIKKLIFSKYRLSNSSFPINQNVLDYLISKKELGHKIFLISGSDNALIIEYCNAYDVFDDCRGSSNVNLIGDEKLSYIRKNISEEFEYIGDSMHADLPIWAAANSIGYVSNLKKIPNKLQSLGKPIHIIRKTSFNFFKFLKLLRVHQWAKNLLIFVPFILGSREEFAIYDLLSLVLGFFILSMLASGTYIFNDLIDVLSDREHTTKKNRPLASGSIAYEYGIFLSIFMIVVALVFSSMLSMDFFITMIGYLILTLSYSLYLKKKLFLDLIALGGLFTARILAGVFLLGHIFPFWLSLFSFLFFISLSASKRYIEINNLDENTLSLQSRAYKKDHDVFILIIGISFAISSIIIFSLYGQLDFLIRNPNVSPINIFIPSIILLTWVSRFWSQTILNKVDHDPVLYAIKDPTSIFLGILLMLFFI